MLLSEMLQVKMDTEFGVEIFDGKFKFMQRSGHERLYHKSGSGEWAVVDAAWMLHGVIESAPSGIIHLPQPLTDEQREQLRAIWTLGGRWLAKDCDGVVNYYTKIPYKESGYWFDNDDAERYGYAIPLSVGVCELQELNDVDEPYDIAAALGGGSVKDNHPNYLYPHGIDPSRIDHAPGNDSIREGKHAPSD